MMFFMDRVYQRGLLLGTIRGAFSGASSGTCPISPPLQLLGVVVKIEKHGYVRHKALNVVMAAFPSNISIFSVVPLCFNTFLVPWNDLECHYQW